jgi:hypothetical protein
MNTPPPKHRRRRRSTSVSYRSSSLLLKGSRCPTRRTTLALKMSAPTPILPWYYTCHYRKHSSIHRWNYIHWYRWIYRYLNRRIYICASPMNIWADRFDFDLSHIFVGGAISPTNIVHHWRIYGAQGWRVWPTYIHWLTDEYRRPPASVSFSLCAHPCRPTHTLFIFSLRAPPLPFTCLASTAAAGLFGKVFLIFS